MVSVLEKKMSRNSRLPPSLLSYSEFWEALEGHLVTWAFETLKLECEATITTRKNIDAKEAADVVGVPTSYLLGADGSALPAGILLGSSLMTRYAAQRLDEAPAQLSGTSPVFLQLLCETPAKNLTCHLSEWMVIGTSVQGITEPSFLAFTTTPIEASVRYVLIEVDLRTSEDTYRVTFLVQLELMLSLHQERMFNLRNGVGQLGRQSSATLRRSVRNSMLDLEVIIDRLDMSVADCSRLAIGQEITLPSAERGSLNLVAKTSRGNEDIAQGELGVWKNFRALKLSTPVSDGFVRNLVDL